MEAAPTLVRNAGTGSFLLKSPAKPEAQHANVTLKRPQWMSKHAWSISLDREMTDPRKHIAYSHAQYRNHGTQYHGAQNQSDDADASAKKVHRSGTPLRVVAQVVTPKLFE